MPYTRHQIGYTSQTLVAPGKDIKPTLPVYRASTHHPTGTIQANPSKAGHLPADPGRLAAPSDQSRSICLRNDDSNLDLQGLRPHAARCVDSGSVSTSSGRACRLHGPNAFRIAWVQFPPSRAAGAFEVRFSISGVSRVPARPFASLWRAPVTP
jgi:hypothetical protein